MKILFVCLGNICRSPTAEGVLRHRAEQAGLSFVEVDSAGTGHWHAGDPPDPRSVAHARKRGVDLSTLRARQVVRADFERFDRIYAMDAANLERLHALCPAAHAHKLSLLLDVLGPTGQQVPDPWAGGPADFEHVLDLCEEACDAIARELGARSDLSAQRR